MFSQRNSKSLSGTTLQNKLNGLRDYYMPMNLDSSFFKKKVIAVTKLNYILKHTTRKNLQEAEFSDLLICSLTSIYYFGMRLKFTSLTSRRWQWCDKREFLKAEAAFQKTMEYLEPERSEKIIIISLNFFTVVSLWSHESFVLQILEVIIYFDSGKMTLLNLMLTDIHRVLFKDIKSARHRMRVMYESLKSENWIIDKHKLLPFVTRLLDFFAYSLAKSENKSSAYKYLRKGFEVCLKRIFERAENDHRLTIITTMLNWFSMVSLSDEDVLEFSLLLDRAVELYKVRSYTDSFSEGLFDHLLRNLIGSNNALHSLIGCRLLRRFLDRLDNTPHLHMPSLYYDFSQVRLKVGQYESGDKIFFRQHREHIHEYFMRAVTKHCHNLVNMIAIFSLIGCIILEVPCGLTAAAAACLMMSVQEYALNGENISATTRYCLHAIVISVMSLICWVHKAPELYCYVSKKIYRRAKEAPQLNPPLLATYNLGVRYVTWNKPSLFFEDWEMRYGLWKHFQNVQHMEAPRKPTKKIPTLDFDF